MHTNTPYTNAQRTTSVRQATRGRASGRLIAGAAVAAGLVLAPTAANAHIGIDADGSTAPGATATLTFAVGHGCDGSPTTGLEISWPDDAVAGVTPIAQAGWDIEVVYDGDAGRPSSVVYTAEEPLADDLRGEIRMRVGISEDAEGAIAFPVEQTCVDGSNSWSEIAADGQDPHELDSPAPVLALGDEAVSGHGHAHDDASEDAAQDDESHDDAASEGDSVLPVALGGAGLAAGLVALALSVVALRRRA